MQEFCCYVVSGHILGCWNHTIPAMYCGSFQHDCPHPKCMVWAYTVTDSGEHLTSNETNVIYPIYPLYRGERCCSEKLVYARWQAWMVPEPHEYISTMDFFFFFDSQCMLRIWLKTSHGSLLSLMFKMTLSCSSKACGCKGFLSGFFQR